MHKKITRQMHFINRILFSFLWTLAIFFTGCTNGQNHNSNLSAKEFANETKKDSSAQVIDVRTPEEFSKGHVKNALNFDWNGSEFEKQISTLDKAKPVYVYCLSGGRSSAAANKMRMEGFTHVYEMDGGIMKWRAEGFPETIENKAKSKGMNREQFNSLLNSGKLVLVDFYADWCAPCKKMKPYLDEISAEMKDRVEVIRINADDNPGICNELQVDALPVLQLYKDKKMIWNHTGYIEKAEVVKQLK
jgi:thioredoxin